MQSRTIAVLNVKESPLMRTNRSMHGTESGFALVLALLSLLLLTFLGLTLAVTTSTELQIATNYRWSEQAKYVAEAGIEAGKVMLRETISWENLLPTPRLATWDGSTTPTAPAYAARTDIRDYENFSCDGKGGGIGYGRVLDGTALGGGTAVPQQYISSFGGQTLSGAFTLWVRRPLHYLPDGTMIDWGASGNFGGLIMPGDNTNLILVAEGMAPFTTMGTSASQQTMMGRAKATYIIEVALSQAPPTLSGCDAPYSGQAGKGADGSNNSKCERLGGDGAMDVAARGSDSGNLGSITETAER